MIEMYSVTHSGRFADNMESSRRQEKAETGFDKLFRGTGVESVDSTTVENKQSDDSTEPDVIVSAAEMVMYSFTGKLSVIGGYSGRAVNIEA